jgi:hypothetical protein
MDLSLIVFAMFKMSSKERLPLCLTENKCNIMPLESKLWNSINLHWKIVATEKPIL